MSPIPLTIDIITVCCLAACLHWHYANWRKHHILVTVATFIAFYFPFMIICVLPIDVSITCYNQCLKDLNTTATSPTLTTAAPNSTDALLSDSVSSVNEASSTVSQMLPLRKACSEPWSYVSDTTLPVMWHVIYWTSQAMTWLMLPMMQSYSKAGEFTVLGKIRYALIANAIYYGTYLIIFSACLIYLVAKGLSFDAGQLKVLAITASNTWGLFLLVLLLGYGLVDVPRTCWYNARQGYMLSKTLFRVAKLSIEKIEAEEELEDVLLEVKKLDETIQTSHPYRKFVNIIVQKVEKFDSLQSSLSITPRSRSTFDGSNDSTDETISEKSLINLNRRTIYAIQHFCSTQCQWGKVIENAMELEDIAQSRMSTSRVFIRTHGPYTGLLKFCYNPTIEWYWKCLIQPWGLRVTAVCLTIFSVIVVWSECLFFIRLPVLSIFALFVQLARDNYNYFAIEFACLITILYLSFCTYYTIFKMRIFNYYNLVGNHQTNENSIIFCGMMLCRLTPPLCLNFLGLIHLDSHVTKEDNVVQTAYTQIMGHMAVISFISDGFNIYFPIAILLLCILTFFKVGNRVLHALGFQQFIGDDDMTQELVDEGAELIKRERRKMLRQEVTTSRRNNWGGRGGGDLYTEQNVGSGSIQHSNSDVTNSRRRTGGQSAIRSGADDSELLNDVEPVAYSDALTSGAGRNATDDIGGLYQSSTTFKPQSLTAGQGYSSSSVRAAASRQSAAPRNIFDDV